MTILARRTLIFFACATSLFETARADIEATPFSAKIDFSGHAYVQRLYDYDSYGGLSNAEFSTGFKGDSFGGKLTPRCRVHAPFSVAGDRRDAQADCDAKEAWIEFLADDWDIRVGNQILSWGSSDAYSPTDVWNASDLIDPLLPEKRPLALAKLSIHPLAFEHVIFDLVASPQFRPHLLPLTIPGGPSEVVPFEITDSRWLIASPSLVRIADDNTVPLSYHVTGADRPQDWQLGGRLRFVRLSDWDFALSASRTTTLTPAFKTRVTGSIDTPTLPIDVTLVPIYYRVSTLGFDASGVLGPVVARFEAALREALDAGASAAIPATVKTAVAGFDYTWSRKKAEIYFNVSFVIQDTQGGHTQDLVDVPRFDPWDRNLVFLGEYRFSSKRKLGLRTSASFMNEDAYISPYGAVSLGDWLAIEAGMDFFVGSESGAYGQYRDNNRFRSSITVAF